MIDKKIAIIGCGNLGLSILNGLLDKKSFRPADITVTKRHIETLSSYSQKGISLQTSNSKAIEASELILLALKPYNISKVLEEIGPSLEPGRHVIISVATGISISQIQAHIPAGIPIFRAMPNTAADVGESLTCICSIQGDETTRAVVQSIFDSIGRTIHIEEELMDSATVLGACGIAYVLRFIRAMVQGGIEIGFDAETASLIVNQTVKGASELLLQRNTHPEQEIDKVTTPKGCTITGLNEMEHNGFSSALIKGILSSYDKIDS
jgi:pyrroline-5-carboxylate reductase